MRAGTLNCIIRIERSVMTLDDDRAPVEAWSPVATVGAQITSLIPEVPGNTASNVAAVFRIRYLAGVKPTDRIVLAGEIYTITAVGEVHPRRGLEIRALAAAS
jgi:head-tail adaptor